MKKIIGALMSMQASPERLQGLREPARFLWLVEAVPRSKAEQILVVSTIDS
jgi:hypothetical protein